jgi:hypothetical protein
MIKMTHGSPYIVASAKWTFWNRIRLSLLPQVGFELGEHAKHVKEGLAGCGARIDRLLSRAQGYPASFTALLCRD